ncbi:hypothetical protein [Arthrobacter sp. TMS1-12-1]
MTDSVETRLVQALDQNVDVINLNREDPVQALLDANLGTGADAIIDAAVADAQRPSSGPEPRTVSTSWSLARGYGSDQTLRGHCGHGAGIEVLRPANH